MNKAGFIGSLASILLGAITLISTSIINELIAKIAYIEFQKLTSGSFSPENYLMNFTFANTAAVILIVSGFVFGIYCFISEKGSK